MSVSVFNRKTSLSSNDILNLNTTPITVVHSPGVGKYIDPLNIIGFYTFGTSAYVPSSGTQLVFTYGNTRLVYANFYSLSTGTTFLSGTQSRSLRATGPNQNAGLDSFGSNLPLTVSYDGTGNLTAGDGTLIIYVKYRILTP